MTSRVEEGFRVQIGLPEPLVMMEEPLHHVLNNSLPPTAPRCVREKLRYAAYNCVAIDTGLEPLGGVSRRQGKQSRACRTAPALDPPGSPPEHPGQRQLPWTSAV